MESILVLRIFVAGREEQSLTQRSLRRARKFRKGLFCEAEAAEVPAGRGAEEVSVCGPNVGRRGDAGAAAEDDLRGHELPVVLAERAGERFVAGIAGVG